MTTVTGVIKLGGGILPGARGVIVRGFVQSVYTTFLPDGSYLIGAPDTITVADDGTWSKDLTPLPTGQAYHFWFLSIDGKLDERTVTVPATGPVTYASLLDVQAPATPVFGSVTDASVANAIGSPGSLTKVALDSTYVSRLKGNAARLLTQLASVDRNPFPAVPGSLPTLTYPGSPSLAKFMSPGGFGIDGHIGTIGGINTYNEPQNRLDISNSATCGLDFYHTGSNLEVTYQEINANGSLIWIFVDGAPLTAAPYLPGGATSSGAIVTTHIAFGSRARRHIQFYAAGIAGWTPLVTDLGDVLAAAPPLPRVAFVGDSFFAGSSASSSLRSAAATMARMLGVNPLNVSYGGTGYQTSTPTFGDAARIAQVVAFKPDLIVISGSVNDSPTGLQSAASTTFAAYATALPGVPIVAFGPQPSNSTDTPSANRAKAGTAVQAAANAAPNVIAYHDMIGTAGTTVAPPAWASFTLYNEHDLVTYLGSVYMWVGGNAGNTGPHTPESSGNNWRPLTWGYTGTGKVGSTTGDGNRDTLLYSDGIHPTLDASDMTAQRQANAIRTDLLAYSLS